MIHWNLTITAAFWAPVLFMARGPSGLIRLVDGAGKERTRKERRDGTGQTCVGLFASRCCGPRGVPSAGPCAARCTPARRR